MPVLLSVPPTSLKHFQEFVSGAKFAREGYFAVFVEIGAEQTANQDGQAYSKIVFTNRGPAELERVKAVLAFRRQYGHLLQRAVEAEDYEAGEV